MWLGAIALVVPAAAAVATTAALTGSVTPSATAASRIPADYLRLYQAAAATCPGLSWTVLAAVGTVESSNGESDAAGVRSGANFAGAEGPMQFEPSTFATYAVAGPGGARPPSPYDPVDAVYSAARLLCANGAGDSTRVADAVYAYNHSDAYVSTVLGLARSFTAFPEAPGGPLGRRGSPKRPSPSQRSASVLPMSGEGPAAVGSTAPGSHRPPTPRLESAFPGSPRISSTQAPSSPPRIDSSRAIWSSSVRPSRT